MLQIAKFFQILFMSAKISRIRLSEFAQDHIQRLTANNPGGAFDTLITDTTTAFNNYNGSVTGEATKKAQREGKTQGMTTAKDDLEKLISDDQKLIAYTYRNDSDTYEEFFPQGVTEYTESTIGNLLTIGQRFKEVLASHAADFSTDFVTEYNDAYGAFKDSRNDQSTAKGNVEAAKSDIVLYKPILCKQLTTNVLTIALKFLGDTSKADVYFDQTMLNAAFNEAQTRVENDIDTNETQNIFDNISTPAINIKIVNTGTEELVFGFENAEDKPVTTLPTVVPAGTTVFKNAGEMGYSDITKFLNVTNQRTIVGSYVVEKV